MTFFQIKLEDKLFFSINVVFSHFDIKFTKKKKMCAQYYKTFSGCSLDSQKII